MTAERIVCSYFVIAGLYTLSAALIWGVNTLFLLDAGLDIFEVFLANAAFTAGMVIFEIPTGVLADTVGRRASFLLSVATLAVTTVGYLAAARLGGDVIAFAAISVVMGLGFTFYSGAVEAWLVDALESVDYGGQLDSVFARGSMVSGAAMLTGTLGGGLLGDVDLGLPYGLRTVMLVAVFAVAWFTMRDLGFKPRTLRLARLPAEMKSVARASLTYGWRARPVRLLMLCSFLQYGFLAWAWYAWQPHFLQLLDRDAVWVAGAVASLLALAMIAGNALADWFSRFCGKRTTLLLWAAAGMAAASMGVGLAGTFLPALALFLAVAFAMGTTSPVKQAYLHNSIPSAQRASVTSFDSMFGNAGAVLSQGGLGYVSRARSIADAYVLGGLVTFLAIPILFALRRLAQPADVIVGKKAGVRSACAGQGVPEVALVDSSPRRGIGADS